MTNVHPTRHPTQCWLATLIAAALMASADIQVHAAAISGTYDTLTGIGSATTPPGASAGPWTMTSTDSTFSALRFTPDVAIPFADYTSLSVDYSAVQGGIGGGSPRISVAVDANGDGVADGFFLIHFGPSPGFVDSTLGDANTGNLLNNDTGRFDLTGIGGINFSDYNAALAAVGTWNVLRFTLILDSFGGNDREFVINSIDAQADLTPIPEPASLALWGVLSVCAAFAARRRRETTELAA